MSRLTKKDKWFLWKQVSIVSHLGILVISAYLMLAFRTSMYYPIAGVLLVVAFIGAYYCSNQKVEHYEARFGQTKLKAYSKVSR